MVEYSTFTPPQAIGFNRPCSVKRQIARKITSHIIHNFMGMLVPKLWEGDLKLHSRFAFQFVSSLSFFHSHYIWDMVRFIMWSSLENMGLFLPNWDSRYLSLLKLHILKGEHIKSKVAFSITSQLLSSYLQSFTKLWKTKTTGRPEWRPILIFSKGKWLIIHEAGFLRQWVGIQRSHKPVSLCLWMISVIIFLRLGLRVTLVVFYLAPAETVAQVLWW